MSIREVRHGRAGDDDSVLMCLAVPVALIWIGVLLGLFLRTYCPL